MQIRRTIGPFGAALAAIIGVVAWRGMARSQQPELPDAQLPRFAQSGQLVKPVGWEAWVMVGSSTGLSYAAAPTPAAGAAPGMFTTSTCSPGPIGSSTARVRSRSARCSCSRFTRRPASPRQREPASTREIAWVRSKCT